MTARSFAHERDQRRPKWLTIRAERIPSVQILRAIAALSVVLGHATYEAKAFVGPGRFPDFFRIDFWEAGVDLFFIISGFIMMWSFGNRFGQPNASSTFLLHRAARIVPSYWAFTLAMIAATLLFKNRLDSAAFTPEHAILSLLLVPHMAPNGGIHPILSLGWTLIYEAFFYLIFSFCLIFPKRIGLIALFLIFLLAFSTAHSTVVAMPQALKLFWGDSIMFEFLFGVTMYLIQSKGFLSYPRLAAVIGMIIIVGAVTWFADVWSSNRLWHYGLPSLAVFSIVFSGLSRVESYLLLTLVLLGEASYTLYLSHPFILEAVKIAFELLQAHTATGAYVLVSVFVAVAFSVFTHNAVEKRVSHWLLESMRHGRHSRS